MKVSDMRPRFMRIRRDSSKPAAQDYADNINAYWKVDVAYVGNDNHVHTWGNMVNGVPANTNEEYTHEDIVYVKWQDRKLILTRKS